MAWRQLLWNATLLATQLIGDRLPADVDFRLKAVADSATHGLVAGISWLLILDDRIADLGGGFESILCLGLGCLIDVDHFIAAGSLSLKEATSLTHRPFLHSMTLLVATTATLATLSYEISSIGLRRLSCIVFVAWFSHQLRDAIRRGFWCPPFGSTPPVPYLLYLTTTAMVPHAIRCLLLFDVSMSSRKFHSILAV